MAAASSSSSPSANAGAAGNKAGLVYSIGLERYVSRAAAALQATKPLIEKFQQLSAASDQLSNATGKAIQVPASAGQAANSLRQVHDQAGNVVGRFGAMVGSSALLVSRLVTLIAVVSAVAKVKAFLSGTGTKTANALGFVSQAASVLGGKISPVAGASAAFVNVMKLLPFRLGAVGNSALAAGLSLGLLSGGIGPLSAGLGLLTVGFKGIPGQLGKIVTSAGSLVTMFGLASAAVTVLTTAITALTTALLVLGPGITFGVKLAAEAEQSQIAFDVMLGSAEKAKAVLGDIRNFAAATPFREDELIRSGRALLAFGEEADNLVPALRRIGDISSGIGAPINEIAELYGKARVQGRLFAVDINQLTNRGIPIIQELAKQFRVTETQVKALVESGQVNFANLEEAFRSLTSAGGRFYGLTARQSQSLLGVWSTFRDSVSASLRDVGEQMVKTGSIQRILAATGNLIAAVTPGVKVFADGLGTAVSIMATFAEITAGVVKTLSSLVGVFVNASAVSKVLIAGVIASTAALIAMAAATKAVAIAKATVLALSGPKGWAVLAVGLAAAGAATVQLAKSMRDAGAETQATTEAVAKLSGEVKAVPPINLSPNGLQERFKTIQEMIEKYASPLDRLKKELREIERIAPLPKFLGEWQAAAIESATGIRGAIRSVSDEIARLNGRTTESEQRLRDMLAAGAPAELVNQLRTLQQTRDAIRENQKAQASLWETSKRAGQADRDAEKTRRDSIKSLREQVDPLARLQSELRDAAKLVRNAGDRQTFNVFAKQQIREFLKSREGNGLQTNQATEYRTAEALSAIIAATAPRARDRSEELLADLLGSSETTAEGIERLISTISEKLAVPETYTLPAKVS